MYMIPDKGGITFKERGKMGDLFQKTFIVKSKLKKTNATAHPPKHSFSPPARPDCIINDNHAYLLEFLDGLSLPERSVSIQDWDTAGRVYLDYIRVIQSLQDIQQVLPYPCGQNESQSR